jgi:hypothetical protein
MTEQGKKMNVLDNGVPAQAVYEKAVECARAATLKHIDIYGENPFGCGFAWVNINPAKGPMVKYLKALGVGGKGYPKGYQIWNPSNNYTQDMDAKYAGAQAFAKVLSDNGVNAVAGCRLD